VSQLDHFKKIKLLTLLTAIDIFLKAGTKLTYPNKSSTL